MQELELFLEEAVGIIWGVPTVLILILSGVGLTFYLGGWKSLLQFKAFPHSFAVIRGKYDNPYDHGEISHFQALCTALSATIGLGNIGIVAVIIKLGGPGAVFWMFLSGFIGMATKYAEATLALLYRKECTDGEIRGGPMYYMEVGLGKKFKPLAIFYAFAITMGSYGFTNMFQTNQAAEIMNRSFGFPHLGTGLVIAILCALVIIGGIKRIGKFASFIVPFMALGYVIGCILVLSHNYETLPGIIQTIFHDAFNGTAVAGGAFISIQMAMLQGIRRACFSNEAGLGSAAIAHSAATTNQPAREGAVAGLGPFVDTMVICTMSALVILSTGIIETSSLEGVPLTAAAFDTVIPGWGTYFIAIAAVSFAFSTMVSWSYYGETAVNYIWGRAAITPYKIIFCVLAVAGAMWEIKAVLNFSDLMIGLMVFPNILAIWLLAPKVKEKTVEYFDRLKAGDFDKDNII